MGVPLLDLDRTDIYAAIYSRLHFLENFDLLLPLLLFFGLDVMGSGRAAFDSEEGRSGGASTLGVT